METRRELANIRTQLDRYHRTIGEQILWAAFDDANSTLDPVYNEPGARRYFTPVWVQTLWINVTESGKRYTDERLDVRNNISAAFSTEALRNAGVPNVFNDNIRIFDIFKYWGQCWAIIDWDILARFPQNDSSTIGILGVAIDLDGDYPFEQTLSIE